MNEEQAGAFAEMWRSVMEAQESHKARIEHVHITLRNAGLLSRVALHRYMCKRGCQLATVFRFEGMTLAAVRDYKYSPGLNAERSVASARERNTLDGNRHWPAHVYDVGDLATWGESAGFDVACGHHRSTLAAREVLASVDDVTPGKPRKPTRLV